MSQPPQNGWGPASSGDPYGQPSPNSGYGAQGQPQPGYGQDGGFAPSFGGGAGQGFMPQPVAPKKSNKVPILVCAGCAVLAFLLVIAGAGIYLFTRDSGDDEAGGGSSTTEPVDGESTAPDGEESTEPVDEETTEPVDEETTEPEEKPAEPEEKPAGGGAGTEDDPYAAGQQLTVEDSEGGTLDVTLGEVNWDATDEVMAENEFNTEVKDGETYILIPVTVTYHGDGTSTPILALYVEFYAESGEVYTDDGTVTPNSSLMVDDLKDGDTGTWDYGMIVPVDAIEGGTFAVSDPFNWDSEPVWVSAV